MDEQRRRKNKIERLLKKGVPRTVEEWKALYGEPRIEMKNEYAREYGLWSVPDGKPLDIDYMMIYGNIFKLQVLYVYAKDGVITHVAVVDQTKWRPEHLVSAKRSMRLL
jgi:hypothetical protein